MNSMRVLYSCLAFLIFSTSLSYGLTSEQKQLENIKAGYTKALQSDIDGLVQSALYNVVLLRQEFPGQDYASIERAVSNLANESKNSRIRYKAQLVLMYFQHVGQLENLNLQSSEDPSPYFQKISNRLEELFLAQN